MNAARYQILDETPVAGGGLDRRVRRESDGQVERHWIGAPGSAERMSTSELSDWATRLARIYHPGIPKVREATTAEGRAILIVQDYPPGLVLSSAKSRFEALEIVRIVRGGASALAKAHARDAFHGFLDEGELFLADDGRSMLLHVGLAPFLDEVAAVPGEDVLALARLLARELSNECDSLPSHPTPEELPETLPEGLRRFVSRALARDPARRISRADEFANDLGVILASWDETSDTRPGISFKKGRVGFLVLVFGSLVALAWWLLRWSAPP